MIINTKIKDDSSRALSSLLLNILESCRQGDVCIAEALGLDINTIRNLDKLKADQINHLSYKYMLDRCALEIFKIDVAMLTRIIDLATAESRTFELADQYLIHGASKTMMKDMFGYRSTQVASRKRLLNIPTVKGRGNVVTEQEERKIYDAWVGNIEIADIRDRYLVTAKQTDLSIAKVYKVVEEIEEIEHQKNISKKRAA